MAEPDVIVKSKGSGGHFGLLVDIVSFREGEDSGGAVTISWEEETGSYSCSQRTQTGEVL